MRVLILAYDRLFGFKFTQSPQDSLVEKLGTSVYLFIPVNFARLGYEDVDNQNKWEIHRPLCFIDFNPARRVYYHFNWFPEDQNDLSIAFFPLSLPVREESFIRTAVLGNDSPYGDMIFKVVKIFDEGKFQVLKRTCFVRPVADAQLSSILKVPSGSKEIQAVRFYDKYRRSIPTSYSIDNNLGIISTHVPVGTDTSKLVIDFDFLGFEVIPPLMKLYNFTVPVVFTVHAEDDSTKAYSVEVFGDV